MTDNFFPDSSAVVTRTTAHDRSNTQINNLLEANDPHVHIIVVSNFGVEPNVEIEGLVWRHLSVNVVGTHKDALLRYGSELLGASVQLRLDPLFFDGLRLLVSSENKLTMNQRHTCSISSWKSSIVPKKKSMASCLFSSLNLA